MQMSWNELSTSIILPPVLKYRNPDKTEKMFFLRVSDKKKKKLPT